jgi:metallophosphoesterase (TIGR03767 family)
LSIVGEGSRLRLTVVIAAVAALAVIGVARALAQDADTLAKTTVQQRIVPNADAGFRELALGPGEGYTVRQELSSAQAGRESRRTSLAYFGQLSDFQLADEESPARVESFDAVGSPFEAAWRPWEALQPQIDNAMVHQLNAFMAASPLANGNGAHSPMDFTINTGDSADNQQLNETRAVRAILEGGTVSPGSGIDPADSEDPACVALAPQIVDADNPELYTGVQDYDDYVEGPNPAFYDPDQPTGQWSDWPTYTGLMDAAQLPFDAVGLNVPSYVVFGNHDALVQGNQAANQGIEEAATGCTKPLSGTTLTPVPPDPDRQFVSKEQYKAIFQGGTQADGHGFDFVDPDQLSDSNGSAGYYAFSPLPKLRFIGLDTTCDAGVAGPSSDGNIDDPQFQWLRGELQAAQAAGQLVVVFSHHAIQSLTCNLPDEQAPACTVPDAHGHDINPGCDVDTRVSAPIHLGADATALLHEFPNAIAWVAGHSHVNDIVPYPDGNGGGFWMIRTAAEADWPQQSRLLQIFDNRDGTLSIFGTVLDHASDATAPASISNLAEPDPFELASIGRTLSYNDPQSGARECSPDPCGEGAAEDRNVELLIRNPLVPGKISARGTAQATPGGATLAFSAANNCDPTLSTQPSIVGTTTGGRIWSKGSVTASSCSDQPPASPLGFDTQSGTATGTFGPAAPGGRNGQQGTLEWIYRDGSPDRVQFTLRDSSNQVVYEATEQAPGPYRGAPGGVWTFGP